MNGGEVRGGGRGGSGEALGGRGALRGARKESCVAQGTAAPAPQITCGRGKDKGVRARRRCHTAAPARARTRDGGGRRSAGAADWLHALRRG